MLSTRHRDSAFSLLEILSSAAIVAVLAALLLPVFQSARFSAQKAKNLANLRVIQAANIAYSAEHDGRFVASSIWDSEGKGVNWHENPEFRANYLNISKTGPWPDGMLSPLATIRNDKGYRRTDRSYGYNYESLGGVAGTPNTIRQAVAQRMRSPSKTLAFADALDWQIKMMAADLYAGKEEFIGSAIAYRYEGRAGVVFFDGHAEMLSRSEVVNNADLWTIFPQ
ncbi:hypothetical protein DB345_09860 [Spartobacteria bacterium LR76]|nr:hypothetical protein DB345_09860 [Spartobacteria bacterium LR76]